MFKFSFLEKITDKLSIIFSKRENSSNTKNINKIKKSNIGTIQQAHNINNDMRNFTETNNHVSDIELKILKKLYLKYKETGQFPRINLRELHDSIGISDGDYVGPVNSSKFLKIDNNDYVIQDVGISFMDSYVRNNKPEIDVVSLAHSGGYMGQELTGLRLINNGSGVAIEIKCYLRADGLKEVNFANIERLNPNEESRSSLGFKYSDTPFFTQPLENLKVVFEYKNKDGFKFTSGRYLSQTKRADGNYNINSSPLGDYFEI